MPCFKRERNLSVGPQRGKRNGKDVVIKPVRPRSMKYHGLLGMGFVSQHLVVDNNWSPDSLNEQFTLMNDLLTRRRIYSLHQKEANRRRLCSESKRLKAQCVDGRLKLQNISTGNNAHEIRNYLIKRTDMQRLYQRMPIDQILENINQRTFVMRKERDRLSNRLDQLKRKYNQLLIDRSDVENRIIYENEFVLEEEVMSRVLLKKIENSSVRLRAIRTINTTYKKMVQVLSQDEIFYEPILRSLDDDIEDQTNMIKHILYLGMPAINEFNELNREFKLLDERSRKNLREKLKILVSLQKPAAVVGPPKDKLKPVTAEDTQRYVRETRSMASLKNQSRSIEETIKNLKYVTLCSQAKEIFPRVKGQVQNNKSLRRKIENDLQAHHMLRSKMKCTTVLDEVLVNNLSEEEVNRLERIRELKIILNKDEDFEQSVMDHINNCADIYVMLRVSIWNLNAILQNVDHDPRNFTCRYPNSYLKLPLLKFELFDMRALPPGFYEEDS
ncbi:uncharacterized protein Dvir_GJ10921, isoform C [Drosophila virilis]|uniref:Uncharacterized protein, isoform C n=1 Tax=Drosophila virilis TaxID=7244 RepID=A0A0Q9WD97_DROVI|nr:uncharacterized protein LOC6632331 isoform X2 [Drosophila virilis]KRF78910.1 uncharacterized protein Dvir_GJ10921, isoform C [Drosophila virilis]